MVNDAPYTGKFTSYTGDVTYIQEGQPVERLTETKSTPIGIILNHVTVRNTHSPKRLRCHASVRIIRGFRAVLKIIEIIFHTGNLSILMVELLSAFEESLALIGIVNKDGILF